MIRVFQCEVAPMIVKRPLVKRLAKGIIPDPEVVRDVIQSKFEERRAINQELKELRRLLELAERREQRAKQAAKAG